MGLEISGGGEFPGFVSTTLDVAAVCRTGGSIQNLFLSNGYVGKEQRLGLPPSISKPSKVAPWSHNLPAAS